MEIPPMVRTPSSSSPPTPWRVGPRSLSSWRWFAWENGSVSPQKRAKHGWKIRVCYGLPMVSPWKKRGVTKILGVYRFYRFTHQTSWFHLPNLFVESLIFSDTVCEYCTGKLLIMQWRSLDLSWNVNGFHVWTLPIDRDSNEQTLR